jgi:hypothetical protein
VIDVSKDTSGVKISHKKSNAGEVLKGSNSEALTITTDMYGHIFSINTSTMYPPITPGVTGQIWVSQGGGRGNWGGITSSTSNVIGVTQNKSGVNITHAKSALAAGNYGGNSSSPVITTDEFGHITKIDSVSVYPPTSKGESGQVWTSGGSDEDGSWVNQSDMAVGAAENAEHAKTAEVADYAKRIVNASDQGWNIGSATQGIYFENGVPMACKYDFATITFKEIDDMDIWKEQE